MQNLIISQKIETKLANKHQVRTSEVRQCFENRENGFLEDDREDNKTDPPTRWFISYTNTGRKLKVVFVFKNGKIFLKTAYPPNDDEIRIYKNIA